MHEETPKVCNRDVSMASSESMQNPPIPKLVTLVRNDQLHRVPAAKGGDAQYRTFRNPEDHILPHGQSQREHATTCR